MMGLGSLLLGAVGGARGGAWVLGGRGGYAAREAELGHCLAGGGVLEEELWAGLFWGHWGWRWRWRCLSYEYRPTNGRAMIYIY